jgi:chondroitin 4-sulfotransferase 11
LRDCIFIHIEKTGGTSIEKALGLAPQQHYLIREIPPQEKEGKFKFAFVRNPWDKVVSQYHFRIFASQTMNKAVHPDFNDWVVGAYSYKSKRWIDYPIMFEPCKYWITEEDGSIGVDFIGRFERLTEDWKVVQRNIGGVAELTHQNKSGRVKDYRTYYNDRTAEIISHHFKDDIEMFGYKFDDYEM